MVWGPNVESASLLYHLNNAATFLSFIGSYYMIHICLKVPRSQRGISLKLILALGIANLIYSISNIMSAFQDVGPEATLFCSIEAGIRATAFFSSIYYSICIALLCYKTAKHPGYFDENHFWRMVLGVQGFVCCTYLLLPFVFEQVKYTNTDIFCIITSKHGISSEARVMIRLYYEGIPICLALIVSCVAYTLTVRQLRKIHESILSSMDINLNKLFWYPAVIFITVFPSIVDNIVLIFLPEVPVYLKAIHVFVTHLIGFSNALVYGIQRRLYKRDFSRRSTQLEGGDEPFNDVNECDTSDLEELSKEYYSANVGATKFFH